MKKYTTPEVEVIMFHAQETIADEVVGGSVGVGTTTPGFEWDDEG